MRSPKLMITDGDLRRIEILVERLHRLCAIRRALPGFQATARALAKSKIRTLGRVTVTMDDNVRISARGATAAQLKELHKIFGSKTDFMFALWAINAPDRVRFDVNRFEEQFIAPLTRELEYFGVAEGESTFPETAPTMKVLSRVIAVQEKWEQYSSRHVGGDYDSDQRIMVGA